MSWKYVLNIRKTIAINYIDASCIAGNAGYQFFLYDGVVYFRDNISCKVFKTKIQEKDLF